MTLAKDLKQGDKIIFDGTKLTVESVETSKVGKSGKAKCRIESKDESGKKNVFITQVNEEIQLQ